MIIPSSTPSRTPESRLPKPRASMHTRVRNALAWSMPGLVALVVGCGSLSRTTLPPGTDDPLVVAVFGDERLTVGDFEELYARSVGGRDAAAMDSMGAYRDFLERYVDFRLKLAAAKAAGLDSKPSVQEELESYRIGLATPYLIEQEVIDPIVRTLYERQKVFVDASHILIRVSDQDSPEDTLEAYQTLETVRDSALQGIDFAELAIRHSQDPSARASAGSPGAGGHLGFFKGGQMVDPFESYAYEMPIGEISPIFRTKFGYHILKVNDRQPATPDIRIAHVMIRYSRAPEDSASAAAQIDSLAAELAQGADFAELARKHSEDIRSSTNGGDLGVVSYTMSIPQEFKEAAFALEQVGDVSEPVHTPFALHLIQLTGREAQPSLEEAYEDLKELAGRLPRTSQAREALARDAIERRGGVVDTAIVVRALAGIPSDSVLAVLVDSSALGATLADTFMVIGESAFTIADLAEEARQSGMIAGYDTGAMLREFVAEFATKAAIDEEAADLEERDPEFARIMQEFRDGLILFEIMEDSVWQLAERDTVALLAAYEAHSEAYQWEDRIRAIGVESHTDSLTRKAMASFDEGASPASLYDTYGQDTVHVFRVDTTLVADSTDSVYDHVLGLSEGERTDIFSTLGTYLFLVHGGIEPARPKTFEEARIRLIGEHQNVLERRLVTQLRQRYNAHTFPDRLVQAFLNEREPPGDPPTNQELPDDSSEDREPPGDSPLETDE